MGLQIIHVHNHDIYTFLIKIMHTLQCQQSKNDGNPGACNLIKIYKLLSVCQWAKILLLHIYGHKRVYFVALWVTALLERHEWLLEVIVQLKDAQK